MIPQPVADLLQPLNVVWLGTVETNAPRLRPMVLIYHAGRQYIATGEHEAKTSQLDVNPAIEWALPVYADSEVHGSLRGRGVAKRVTDPAERAEIHAAAPFIAQYFPLPTDPEYVLFRLDITHYELMPAGADSVETFDL